MRGHRLSSGATQLPILHLALAQACLELAAHERCLELCATTYDDDLIVLTVTRATSLLKENDVLNYPPAARGLNKAARRLYLW